MTRTVLPFPGATDLEHDRPYVEALARSIVGTARACLEHARPQQPDATLCAALCAAIRTLSIDHQSLALAVAVTLAAEYPQDQVDRVKEIVADLKPKTTPPTRKH